MSIDISRCQRRTLRNQTHASETLRIIADYRTAEHRDAAMQQLQLWRFSRADCATLCN